MSIQTSLSLNKQSTNTQFTSFTNNKLKIEEKNIF